MRQHWKLYKATDPKRHIAELMSIKLDFLKAVLQEGGFYSVPAGVGSDGVVQRDPKVFQVVDANPLGKRYVCKTEFEQFSMPVSLQLYAAQDIDDYRGQAGPPSTLDIAEDDFTFVEDAINIADWPCLSRSLCTWQTTEVAPDGWKLSSPMLPHQLRWEALSDQEPVYHLISSLIMDGRGNQNYL